jgi:CheY-like chemotaxis protein
LAVARAILEAVEAIIATAGDGIQALDLLRNEAFDVVLMDVHMPRMGGVETLEHIRSSEVGQPDIPVIAMTADAMTGVDAELLALGFDRVAPKPISPAQLIWTISELGLRRAEKVRAA